VTAENGGSVTSSQEHIVDLLNRQIEILQRIARPYVVVDIYPRRYVNSLYFRIRNVGQTPAFQVQVKPDKTIPIGRESSSELSIFEKPIGVLGEGDEISFFFGSALELFREEEETAIEFDVELSYVDSTGRTYEEKISVDLDLLRGLAVELPAIDKLVDKLERTRKEISKIARYAERLRLRDLTSAAEEVEKKADELTTEDDSD
jgi:hypothetical protein